jgi:hypothetical protein
MKKKSLEEVCVINSSYTTGCLKKRLFNELNWEHKCSFCGLKEWKSIMNNNKIMDIPLQLDHINGNNKDHRLENLRLLCPNCHATTSTFSGRNKKHSAPKPHCIDCNCLITRHATRCKKCSYMNSRIVNRPTKETLIEEKKTLTYVSLGKKYNVSDNTVRKWINSM